MTTNGSGTKDDPWQLTTPSGKGDYQMYRDGDVLVCQVAVSYTHLTLPTSDLV